MKELARSMNLLPNLHTVRLRIPSSRESLIGFDASLESFSYNQIRSMIISAKGYTILKHCPMLQSFQMLDYYPLSPHQFLDLAPGCCPLLEKIPTVTLADVLGEF